MSWHFPELESYSKNSLLSAFFHSIPLFLDLSNFLFELIQCTLVLLSISLFAWTHHNLFNCLLTDTWVISSLGYFTCCCGTILLYMVKICHSNWFDKMLTGQQPGRMYRWGNQTKDDRKGMGRIRRCWSDAERAK